jgi:hypothetical protein
MREAGIHVPETFEDLPPDSPGDDGLGDGAVLDGLNHTVLLNTTDLTEQHKDLAKTEVQFGHAGASANSDLETAVTKNKAMREAGIHEAPA